MRIVLAAISALWVVSQFEKLVIPAKAEIQSLQNVLGPRRRGDDIMIHDCSLCVVSLYSILERVALVPVPPAFTSTHAERSIDGDTKRHRDHGQGPVPWPGQNPPLSPAVAGPGGRPVPCLPGR